MNANDEVASLLEVVRARFAETRAKLKLLVKADGKSVFRVDRADGPPWLLRAYAPGTDLGGLASDIDLLRFLERRDYSAPRIVPAIDDSPLVFWHDRPVLMTAFVSGRSTDFSPPRLRSLGAVLGQLHMVPLPGPSEGSLLIRPAAMLPAREISYAAGELKAVEGRVPRDLRPRFDVLRQALLGIDHYDDLPVVLIHNDCHPGNSVMSPDGQPMLVDWEGAGLGPAIIDVGFLLVSCEIEAFRPNRLSPDPARVNAVVDGYRQHRVPTGAEFERLPDAIRFRSIVAGAGAFSRMIRQRGRDEGPEWWWTRYLAADEIAERARNRFEAEFKAARPTTE